MKTYTETYIGWSVHTVERTHGGNIVTVVHTHGWDTYTEGNLHGGDIHMEEQTYGKRYTDIHTEGTYTRRERTHGEIHGWDIHMEELTHGGDTQKVYNMEGTHGEDKHMGEHTHGGTHRGDIHMEEPTHGGTVVQSGVGSHRPESVLHQKRPKVALLKKLLCDTGIISAARTPQ